MWEQLLFIGREMLESFLGIWPYLLITIPIAVGVQLTGAAKHINRVLGGRPALAILGATLIGAFSPLCACGVVPLIASLLIGGVPLAPIMAFWIASPTMDVEIFFLSVGFIGWELAVWRLAATLILSLGAGFAAHWLTQSGWLDKRVLRADYSTRTVNFGALLGNGATWIRQALRPGLEPVTASGPTTAYPSEPTGDKTRNRLEIALTDTWQGAGEPLAQAANGRAASCCASNTATNTGTATDTATTAGANCDSTGCATFGTMPTGGMPTETSFTRRLLHETGTATLMVAKFMAFAFILQALIKLYVPEAWIVSVLGNENPFAVLFAALLGMPVYTSNLAALPMVGGLLDQGMNGAAALAFLISGPMLTLPSMAAVWALANRRVFLLYVGFAFVGALAAGFAYGLAG